MTTALRPLLSQLAEGYSAVQKSCPSRVARTKRRAAIDKKQVLHFVQDDKVFWDRMTRFRGIVAGRLTAWVLVLSLG
jgi:hypothetical protein